MTKGAIGGGVVIGDLVGGAQGLVIGVGIGGNRSGSRRQRRAAARAPWSATSLRRSFVVVPDKRGSLQLQVGHTSVLPRRQRAKDVRAPTKHLGCPRQMVVLRDVSCRPLRDWGRGMARGKPAHPSRALGAPIVSATGTPFPDGDVCLLMSRHGRLLLHSRAFGPTSLAVSTPARMASVECPA